MSELLCVSSRALCSEDFLLRTEKIAAAHPAAFLLREKDLPEPEYRALARAVLQICQKHRVPCILHSFVQTAAALSCPRLHLPMPVLRTLSQKERSAFSTLGASCHSVEQALEAQRLGCSYITAGHIFDTDCKPGLPGRGLAFLSEVCARVSIPVYAIGGIRPERFREVKKAGAAGVCVMSGAMRCENVAAYFAAFEERENEI